MNIGAVRTLLLALELGSLSAAATRLGVPASTVSRRVKELEAELGTRLMVRSGRGVTPAEDALDLIDRLREILVAVDECYQVDASIKSLKITAPLELTISLLPHAIVAFNRQYPDVLIELHGENRMSSLIEEDFDLAIRTGNLDDPNLIGKRIATGGFVLVATPQLAQSITSVEQLAKTPVIEIMGPTPGVSGHWLGEAFSVHSSVLARLTTFSAALPILNSGIAYAQMPPHLVKPDIREGRLVQISQVTLHERPIHVLYPRRHRDKGIVKAFIAEVQKLLNTKTKAT